MKLEYTREEVIQLLLEERKRAVDIAYEFCEENRKAFESKKNAGYDLAFVSKKVAEECRFLGNAISGGNALSVTLGETMRDRIEKNLDKLSSIE